MSSGGRRVLHVEDDELNRILMEHVVALVDGWSVVPASTLAEARAIIDAELVDGDRASSEATSDATTEATIDATSRLGLVLVDLDLPDGSGDELVLDLRRRGSHVPVWAVTGDASSATAERLRSSGIDRVLVKPFDIAALIADLSDID